MKYQKTPFFTQCREWVVGSFWLLPFVLFHLTLPLRNAIRRWLAVDELEAAGDRRDALLVQLEAELAGCSGDLLVTSLALHDACLQLHRECDFHLAKEFDALEASLVERGYVWDSELEMWKAPSELEA